MTVDARAVGLDRRAALLVLAAAPFALCAQTNVPPEAFPDIVKGDRITGVFEPGVTAKFFFNGQPRGEIRDADFALRFFGIWLSPKTSEPKLRDALLGGAKAGS